MCRNRKYRHMRKHFLKDLILTFGIAVCCAFLLSGCAGRGESDAEPEKKKTIAVSTIVPTHGWTEGVLQCAERKIEEVAERNDWNYLCLQGEDSYDQSRQVMELIEQKVDCIILLPMDGASLRTAAVSVQNADIPLIIFDREIPEFAPTATVKGDNEGIGRETARFFNNYFPKGTTVLELMGDTSTVPFLRTDGFDKELNDRFTKIQIGYTEWQRDITRKLFSDWVEQQDPELLRSVGAIFTHDDEIALGVLDILDEMEADGRLDQYFPELQVIAGSSNSQEMYRRILEEDRYILFSMTYLPKMIEQAIETGASVLLKENYSEMTVIPTILVGKTNVRDYIE